MNFTRSSIKRIFSAKPEYIFVVLAGFFGLIAVFVVPPGWNSDEYQHFFRVEQLSDGQLFARDSEGQKTPNGASGGYIDRSALEFIGQNGFENQDELDRSTISPIGLWQQSADYSGGDDKVYVTFSGSAVYPPLTYLPQVVGNTVNKLLGGSVYNGFLLSRITGLAFYLILIFWSIRLIPVGKWILMTIALLATSVVQATALGADAVTFSLVAFFIAYVMKLAYAKSSMTIKQLVVLLILMVCLGLVKPTYFVLTPLVALIPILNKANLNKKMIIRLVITVVLSVLPALIWLKLVSYVGTNGGPSSDKGLQLNGIIQDPFSFISAVVNTYFGTNAAVVWNHFFDVAFRNFVWDSVRFSSVYSYLAIIAIVISLGIRDGLIKRVDNVRQWLSGGLMIAVFIATFLVINLAIYIYFSPVGQDFVNGVQARYIFPFMILLLLPLQNYYKNQMMAKGLLVALLTICLTASLTAIYQSIYV